MPSYIYIGLLGQEEKIKYGEKNWYDWRCNYWGTMRNSEDAIILNECSTVLEYYFQTLVRPSEPVILTLAEAFPDAQIYYSFDEPGKGFCGERQYENGGIIFQTDGEYQEIWYSEYEPKEDIPKYEIGKEYLTSNETECGNTLEYDFIYRDVDTERMILINGHCVDERIKKEDQKFSNYYL